MNERPILFSDAMVRAILSGAKTQTRRVVEPMPGQQSQWLSVSLIGKSPQLSMSQVSDALGAQMDHPEGGPLGWVACLYGKPGARLWVRERFSPRDKHGRPAKTIAEAAFVVLADGAQVYRDGEYSPALARYAPGAFDGIKYRPAIHMPRWASRLTLEVTSVRVERVQSINDEDARAEGALYAKTQWANAETVRDSFAHLWDSINGKRPRCSWCDNPWVWVVGFRRMT